tara:strand:- start:1213 stop:1362 length:150 start_codon:yes stop_codon:yes gene_type:complete
VSDEEDEEVYPKLVPYILMYSYGEINYEMPELLRREWFIVDGTKKCMLM